MIFTHVLQCPDTGPIENYCNGLPNKQKRAAEKACSYIRSDVFKECQEVVSTYKYYKAFWIYNDKPINNITLKLYYL